MNNQMNSTCTNCSASIKNVVIIQGKPYGTTCAEKILGKSLPKNFSGDYDKYEKEQKIKHEESVSEFNKVKGRTRKYWNQIVRLNSALISCSNDWERNFVSSIAGQAGLPLIYTPAEYIKETMDQTYTEENWPASAGSYHYIYREPKGLDNLSVRQLEILERIEG